MKRLKVLAFVVVAFSSLVGVGKLTPSNAQVVPPVYGSLVFPQISSDASVPTTTATTTASSALQTSSTIAQPVVVLGVQVDRTTVPTTTQVGGVNVLGESITAPNTAPAYTGSDVNGFVRAGILLVIGGFAVLAVLRRSKRASAV
jgi:hypothetical protein